MQEINLEAPFTFLQHNQAMSLEGDMCNVTNQMATVNVGVDPALAVGAVLASQTEAAAMAAADSLVIGQVQAQAATETAAVREEAVAAASAAQSRGHNVQVEASAAVQTANIATQQA